VELYLVRHGIAEEVAESDAERALTPDGISKAKKVAKAFAKRVSGVELILHSPYRRARETAEIFAASYPKAKLQVAKNITPHDKAHIALAMLSNVGQGAKVMVVGHEPHLSCLASLLITGSERPVLEFRKAGIAGIACTGNLQSCYLMFLLTPKMMI
jgi:phosphohistidine phosphatase